MTDTPKTDALMRELYEDALRRKKFPIPVREPIDRFDELCRQLERENAELRKDAERWCAAKETSMSNDALIAKLVALAEEYDPAPEGRTLTPVQAIIDFLHDDEVREALCASAPADVVAVPIEIVNFLNGVSPLDGVHFGEDHPTERGKYWWRKHLIAAARGLK